jgi:hypothetical protein
MSETSAILEALLEENGYQKSISGHDVIWRLQNDDAKSTIQGRVEILERKSLFHITKCQLRLNPESIAQKIRANFKKRFTRTASWMHTIETDGRIRIIAEVSAAPDIKTTGVETPARRSTKMGTCIGWTVNISHINSQISLQITDTFLIGDYISHWWPDLVTSVAESYTPFSLKAWTPRHLAEFQIPLAIAGGKAKKAKSQRRPFNETMVVELPIPLKITKSRDLITLETTLEPATQAETPLEIIEARETSETWKSIDTKILLRKQPDAVARHVPLDNDVLMRLAAEPNLKIEHPKKDLVAIIDSTTDRSLMSMTGITQLASRLESQKSIIQHLSATIRQISETYGAIDSLDPLSRVVPETLGDAWASVDPNMAYRCWNVALENSSQNPRILRKISQMAKTSGNLDIEIDATLKILAHGRRKVEIAEGANRLVEIMESGSGATEAWASKITDGLERALGLCNDDPTLALQIAEILAINGRHRDVLTHLDAVLSQTEKSRDAQLIFKTNLIMARIWHKKEGNIKLANYRYNSALSSGAKISDNELAEFEQFFIESKNSDGVERVMQMRASQPDPQARVKALHRSALYNHKDGNLQKSSTNVIELLSEGIVDIQYLTILESANQQLPTMTQALVIAMMRADISGLTKDEQIRWKLSATRAGLEIPELQSDAIVAMTTPGILPLLSSKEANIILKHKLAHADSIDVSNFISNRLPYADQQEYQHLLVTVTEKDLISADGLYENAFASLAGQSQNLSLSKARLLKHIQSERVKELRALLKAHEISLQGTPQVTSLRDNAIDQICASQNQIFAEELEDLCSAAISDTSPGSASRNTIIHTLIASGFLAIGKGFLINEIESGNICIVDETVVESLLADDTQSLADWHKLCRNTTNDPKRRLAHSQRYFDLWMRTNERPSFLIDVLEDFGSRQPLSVEKLELLEFLCVRERKLERWLKQIANKISSSDQDGQNDLLCWAVRVINSRLDNFERSAEFCIQVWTDKNELNISENFMLSSLYAQAGSIDSAQTYLLKILNNPEILNHPAVLKAGLDMLSRCRLDKAHFATITQTLLSWARTGTDSQLTDYLIERSIEWQVASNEDLNAMFKNHFHVESADRLATMAVQILSKAERSGGNVQRMINDWREQFSLVDQQPKWLEMVAILNKDRYLGLLKKNARSEVIHFFANHLYSSDSRRLDSIPVFETLAQENPLDNRSWIPLYSLYEETGARQKLISHLERVIPLIQKDRSILEQTPFTLESLTNSLRKARAANQGGFELHIDRASSKQKDFEIQERAAQMQKAWISATPMIQIGLPQIALQSESDTNPTGQNSGNNTWSSGMNAFDAGAAVSLAPETDHQPIHQFSETSNTEKTLVENPDEAGSRFEGLDLETGSRTGRNPQINWRDLIVSERVSPGTTERIMTMAFASDIEKHIAVQCIALINGDMRALDAWHWQAWRKPETCDYSLSPKGRMPDFSNLKHYGGPLHKLLRLMQPILTRAARSRFVIDAKLQELGIPSSVQISPVEFEHPIMDRLSLSFFRPHIEAAKIRFMDTPGMGNHVFFDLRTRFIHFDAQWQARLPRTVLAHKFIELIVNHQRGQNVLIELNPVTQILPILDDISSVLTSSGIARLQIAFGIQHRDISQDLRHINKDQLVSLLSVAGKPSARDIKALQYEMKIKTLATILASTLDVVGIMESLCERDLFENGVLTPKSILKMNPLAKEILELATNLKI